MRTFLCVTPFIQGDGARDAAIAKAASATRTPSTHAPEALLPRRWVQGGDSGEAGRSGGGLWEPDTCR